MPAAAAEVVQTAGAVIAEVPWHGAAGNARGRGDAVVREAVALEPQDLHLPLDAGVGVVIAVVGDRPQIRVAERDRPHDFKLQSGSEILLRAVILGEYWAAVRCVRSNRAEYNSAEYTVAVDELHAITGEADVQRLDRELDSLRAQELIVGGFDVFRRRKVDLTPTALALHTYVRGQGSRLTPVEFFKAKTLDEPLAEAQAPSAPEHKEPAP